ncbi:MAG: diadenosine tetraphosphatase [Psychromonas sp.]|nr:diadenosine tetraphosphatase [Psychromonas sp.]
MEFRHLMIDATIYKRIFVVGDIHGKLDLLKHMLQQVEFDACFDILVSVGDLIDRGPESAATLAFYAQHSWFYAIAGNHEILMADAMRYGGPFHINLEYPKPLKLWYKNGGEWALQESQSCLDKLNEIIKAMPCALTLTLNSGKTVGISHAQPHTLNWQEMQQWQGDVYDKPRWIWGRTRIKGEPSEAVSGVDYTIHGHTATQVVERVANSLFIDTSSIDEGQGHLTFYELNSEVEFTSIRQDQLDAEKDLGSHKF